MNKKVREIVFIMLTAIIMVSIFPNAVVSASPTTREITATFGATKYILNGEPFSESTIVYNDVAYLPAFYLATKLGLTASWDAATNTTTLKSGGTPSSPAASASNAATLPGTRKITVVFGATQYILDGEPFSEPTMLYNNTAYLPAFYLATKLGFAANWDSITNTTTLNSRGTPSYVASTIGAATAPGTRRITVIFDATKYILDGAAFNQPTMLYNDTAYLPAFYLATRLGFFASWDAETNTTTLTSR